MANPSVFAPGSLSLRLYPHNELPAAEIVEEMREQARLAVAAGFDGVMTSEHHGGFAGYLPNPTQMAGWLLEAMPRGWAAPCPLLLPLRPPALVIEEIAWLAARFPGRVGLGVAAGSLEADFSIMGTTKDALVARFTAGLGIVTAALSGRDAGALAGDPAVAGCRDAAIPVLSAAMSVTASRRAAAAGAGLLFAGVSSAAHCREMADAYRAAGGAAPVILVRRAWVGEEDTGRHEKQVDVYKSYTTVAAQSRWGGEQLLTGSADTIAARLVEDLRATGADALNLRVHVPGITPAEARRHITGLGAVVARLAA